MTGDSPSEGYLFDLYRQYIGEPEARSDVYAGFGLFIGGIGFAIAALVLFLWSSRFERRSAEYVVWAEPAFAFGLLALPLVLFGIVVLLPHQRRMLYTSAVGVAITFVAVGGFLYAFPDNWNVEGTDYTAEVIAVYAVGLAGLTASTGAALIAHYLDMARTITGTDTDEEEADDEDELTDAEIQQDIDDAMDNVELSWGGVEKQEGRQLSFSGDDFDEVNVSAVGTTTVRSSGVDQQVTGLKGLQGGETKTTTSSSTVDDQTQKLKELREQQRQEAETTEADTKSGSLFGSLRRRIQKLLGRN